MVLLATLAEAQSYTSSDLEGLRRYYGALVFIIGVGLAGLIILISLIVARRAWQRRQSRDAFREREKPAGMGYHDTWAEAGHRYRGDDEESASE